MSIFVIACIGLVLLSGLFLLTPLRFSAQDDDQEAANLDWYRQRESELAAESFNKADGEALAEDARLRLLEEHPGRADVVAVPAGDRRFAGWLLLPVIAVLAAWLYYRLGGFSDVLLSERIQTLSEQSPATEVATVMADIEKRLQQRPDNLHYRLMLGHYFMGQEDFGRAAAFFSALAQRVPEDAQVLAYAAQSSYLAANRVLDSDSQHLAEQALAIDPGQRTALGLLGMVAFERGHYRGAIDYWQRLRQTEQPGSPGDQMIADIIERAHIRLKEGESVLDNSPERINSPEPGSDEQSAISFGVTVQVSLPAQASVDPGDTVFVFARRAGSDNRMPIAVQRLSAASLPFTVRLDDSRAMAGQKLSSAGQIEVVVQLSPSGQPGESNASWLGKSAAINPGFDEEILHIELSPHKG
ncbi:MAG: c-type cytochrome biogenesis protein CcmI [Parahaliea sp.]